MGEDEEGVGRGGRERGEERREEKREYLLLLLLRLPFELLLLMALAFSTMVVVVVPGAFFLNFAFVGASSERPPSASASLNFFGEICGGLLRACMSDSFSMLRSRRFFSVNLLNCW